MDLSDTIILKGTHPRTIPARFGLIWFRGLRGEDLNVKAYDVRRTTPSDGKSSPDVLKRTAFSSKLKESYKRTHSLITHPLDI